MLLLKNTLNIVKNHSKKLSLLNYCGASKSMFHTTFQASQNESSEKKEEKFESSSNSTAKSWKIGLAVLSFSALTTFGSVVYQYGPPDVDENGNDIPDEYSQQPILLAYFRRAIKQCYNFNETIQAPVSDKLLPDPLPPPYYQPKYTLVLEVNGVLLHPDWTFRSGWRFKKRPALDLFLQQVSTCFEVVVFTDDTVFTLGPVLERIDNEGRLIHHRLFREATRYEKGVHIKDLSCLNRDLSKIIIVDWNPNSFKLQPRNAFPMEKWTGNEDDRELLDLAAFLRMIATSNVDDVRTVLDYYRQFDEPMVAFKDNQAKVMDLLSKKESQPSSPTLGRSFLKYR